MGVTIPGTGNFNSSCMVKQEVLLKNPEKKQEMVSDSMAT